MKPDLSTLAIRTAGFCVSRRIALFTLSTLVCMVFAVGLLNISFDGSFDALLTESDPYLDELAHMDEEFPLPSSAAFIFVADDGKTVFDRDILEALNDLRESYRSIPNTIYLSTIVDWISPQTQRRLFVKPVTEYSEEEFSLLATEAVKDSLLTSNLLSPNGELTFANLTLNTQQTDQNKRIEIARAIQSLRDELRLRHPSVTLYTGSDLILEQVSQASMVKDLTSLLPFVNLVCVLVICFCFRSITLGACILIHAVVTVASTIGIVNLLEYSFNSITVIAPLVVIIIAIANCVHIISIYRQALQQGKAKLAAMEHSLAYNFLPVSLAALTTTIGFSSLSMTSSPAIQEFGQIIAIGIVLSFSLTFAMLPTMMVLLTRWSANADPNEKLFMQDRLEQLVIFTERQDRKLFISCTILALVTAMLLPLNETDFNRLDFIANDDDIRQYYDEIANRMNRGPALSYAIDTGVENGVLDTQFLNEVEQFGEWLLTQDVIESQASLVEVLKTINRFVNDQSPEFFTLPKDEQTVENYLEAFAMVNSREFPSERFINEDASAITLTINATRISNQEVINLDQRITEAFPEFFQSAELIHGSALLLFSRMDELVTSELLQGYSISLLLITLTLVIGLGSLYFGVLSVVPNLLPATIVFGFWALFVGQLDPFVMMLFSISIGLVVDDTVHILSHYLESRRLGTSQNQAIARSIQVAGPALTITTMVLALGTTILIFANSMYFQQSAKLLVPIVVLALVLDLAYLPSVLRRFDKKAMLNA
ncbi:MAG: MMPL family transporter [Gammaproteobacteria bacterium]|nr:MMPL family transporter [Gammaproteobacteria bacterium]